MAKRLTTGERIRRYMEEHPLAKPKQIAEALGVKVQYVHTLRSTDKKRLAQGMPINRIPRIKRKKKVILHAGEALIAQKMGVSIEDYAKSKLKLKKPKLWQPPKLLPVPTPQNTLSITMVEPKADPVNHPPHYKVGGIETIDFIEAKELNYNLGNVVKYITRADHKGNRKQDLEKALWYLKREINAK